MLERARKTYNNAPDRQENGVWLKSWNITSGNTYHQYRSRAYNVWMSIESRTNGATNGFQDFQTFTDWCQERYGYMRVDPNGRLWSIEKDMLVLGNSCYKPETCMFVPSEVNSILNFAEHKNAGLPFGVHVEPEERKWIYKASCKGGNPVAKRFNCEFEAHLWWLEQKIKICNSRIEKYKEHVVLAGAIERIRNIFEYHQRNKLVLPFSRQDWKLD